MYKNPGAHKNLTILGIEEQCDVRWNWQTCAVHSGKLSKQRCQVYVKQKSFLSRDLKEEVY